MQLKRENHELPFVIAKRGWRYHHMGIPTTVTRPNERYIPHLKIYASGFESSPYGIEWIRFDPDCNIPEIIRTIPHIAFEVDDLDSAIEGLTLIGEISSLSEGTRVAMVIDNGAPIELIEFSRKKSDIMYA